MITDNDLKNGVFIFESDGIDIYYAATRRTNPFMWPSPMYGGCIRLDSEVTHEELPHIRFKGPLDADHKEEYAKPYFKFLTKILMEVY